MRFVRAFAALSLLAVLVLLSGGGSQGQPRDPPKSSAKALPKFWDKLDLSDEQRKEIVRLTTEQQETVEKLREGIRKIEAESANKRVADLTDKQKEKLVGLLASSEPIDKTDTNAKEK